MRRIFVRISVMLSDWYLLPIKECLSAVCVFQGHFQLHHRCGD
jgi:hypothetical protein